MRKHMIGIVAAVAVALVPLGAIAEHDSSPAWTPIAGVKGPLAIGTGATACADQTVTLHLEETTFNYTTGFTSGKVWVSGSASCLSLESGVEADIGVSIYQQRGQGHLDSRTFGRAADWDLVLLTTFTCPGLDPLTDRNTCRTAMITFRNGPGTRLVATNGTLYRLIDPRGGAFFFVNPLCRPSTTSHARFYCLTTSELRS